MSGKVNSYKGEKIIITTQTNYLKATTKRNQRKDENKAAYQMLKIPRVGGWENREKEKSTSMNTKYG